MKDRRAIVVGTAAGLVVPRFGARAAVGQRRWAQELLKPRLRSISVPVCESAFRLNFVANRLIFVANDEPLTSHDTDVSPSWRRVLSHFRGDSSGPGERHVEDEHRCASTALAAVSEPGEVIRRCRFATKIDKHALVV